MMRIGVLVDMALNIYGWTIFAYILLSWLQTMDWAIQVRRMLEPVVEPYLGLFRRIVPQSGMVDFSPLVGLLVLQFLVRPAIAILFGTMGL